MTDALHEQITRLIHKSQRVAVVSHIRPDGDAIGSLLGLGLSLQAAGKEVQMLLADGLPKSFRHLPGSDQIIRRLDENPDLVVVVDCSDPVRIGSILPEEMTPDLNIDHHITNLGYARLNLIDPAAAATACMLAEHLPRWGLPIDQAVAEALLTGIISDTLGFRTSNVTSHTLRLAAGLIEYGANLSELYNRALVQRSYEAVRFWAFGLERLQRQGQIVWTSLTLEDRKAANYPGNDDADLINLLSTIDEGAMTIIFVEQREGQVKVSWRAQPNLDVSKIALQFGGGGHPAAAGAEITGDLREVQEQVLQVSLAALNREPNDQEKFVSVQSPMD